MDVVDCDKSGGLPEVVEDLQPHQLLLEGEGSTGCGFVSSCCCVSCCLDSTSTVAVYKIH